ncbi:MAG TPA: DUF4384 domain-containing protein [Blastocatellia bacterium]|nr:DUF4384 domain-containing protein [Blastocatellia bacterium]
MRSRLSMTCLCVAMAGALLAAAFFSPGVEAQKQGAPLWYSVATVKRVQKPNRRRTRPVSKTGTQRTALLTLQWRWLERGDNNVQKEVDPKRVFRNQDQLKLAVTTNQDGYLYVIHRMNNGDGKLVFPDPRSNDGRNEVKKNQEYTVPSYCPSFDDPNDCWWEMAPPTGLENFIVVFSRDQFEKLPLRVTLENGEYEYPIVTRDLIEDLINTSRQEVREATGRLTIPGKPAARFATRLQNTNLQDNEELIARIQLKHGD